MKTLRLLGLALLFVFTGCMHRYSLTLTNGNVITAKSRPELDKVGNYHFKDGLGHDAIMPQYRVTTIERK